MSLDVFIGGVSARTIAPYGDLEYTTAANGGSKAASWNFDLPATYVSDKLRRGARVDIKTGPITVWRGVIDEVDPTDDWAVSAKGAAELAYGDGAYLCFDSAGNGTSVPDTAIDQAISRGLPWVRRASFSSAAVAASTTTDQLNKLGDLLDAYCESVGRRWRVDPDGAVSHAADPTSPTWFIRPGSARFGLADDDFFTDVYVRYLTTSGTYATATAGDATARARFGRRENAADRTMLGAMTAAKAQAIADGIVKLGAPRLAWSNSIEVSSAQILSVGGTSAHLPLVRGGQLARMYGVSDEQGIFRPYIDWVIGETRLQAGADVITLSPLGLAERTLGDILSGEAAA